jgi:hypothetical protein
MESVASATGGLPTACPHCGAVSAGTTCISCGRSITPEIGLDLAHPFRVYFGTLWQLLTHPTRFFEKMPISGGASGPLAFALITHWLGSALSFLWAAALSGAISSYSSGIFKIFGDVADIDHPGRSAMIAQARDRLVHWIWGAGSILVDPFVTLVSIAFTSFFVWMGARLFVNPKPEEGLPSVTYESALRIVCFGMTPSILAVIPIFGPVISGLCVILVTIIGARVVYRIDTGRAILVALFPKLLWIAVILGGIAALALVALKMVTSVLGT